MAKKNREKQEAVEALKADAVTDPEIPSAKVEVEKPIRPSKPATPEKTVELRQLVEKIKKVAKEEGPKSPKLKKLYREKAILEEAIRYGR